MILVIYWSLTLSELDLIREVVDAAGNTIPNNRVKR